MLAAAVLHLLTHWLSMVCVMVAQFQHQWKNTDFIYLFILEAKREKSDVPFGCWEKKKSNYLLVLL